MILWAYLIGHSNLYIPNFESFFSSRTRKKPPIRFKGGVVDLIYPNEPSIESLQLMFGAEEKEEICRKWVFMIR